jgi:pimeloyl-ACP methyl ester carboxylesterase
LPHVSSHRHWRSAGNDESDAFKDAARWLAQHIRGARLEFIPQAAHASVLEQPVAIEALLRKFLA